jgi:hypothetical protein
MAPALAFPGAQYPGAFCHFLSHSLTATLTAFGLWKLLLILRRFDFSP